MAARKAARLRQPLSPAANPDGEGQGRLSSQGAGLQGGADSAALAEWWSVPTPEVQAQPSPRPRPFHPGRRSPPELCCAAWTLPILLATKAPAPPARKRRRRGGGAS